MKNKIYSEQLYDQLYDRYCSGSRKLKPHPVYVGIQVDKKILIETIKMNKIERKKAIESLKQICQEIGCSGLNPDLCLRNPHRCDIIRKLCNPTKKETT